MYKTFLLILSIVCFKEFPLSQSQTIHTPFDNPHLREYYKTLFTPWKTDTSSVPVDFSTWDGFERKCLNFLRNYCGEDVSNLNLPLIILRPFPVIVNEDENLLIKNELIWHNGLNGFISLTNISNNGTWIASKNITNSMENGLVNYFSFVTKSKPWNCEIEVDLLPPLFLHPFVSQNWHMILEKVGNGIISILETTTKIWFNINSRLLQPGKVPSLKFFVFPQYPWYSSSDNVSFLRHLKEWTVSDLSSENYNCHFCIFIKNRKYFVANLVPTENPEGRRKVVSFHGRIDFNPDINLHRIQNITRANLFKLEKAKRKLIIEITSPLSSRLSISFYRIFKTCNRKINYLAKTSENFKALTETEIQELYYQAIVEIWMSIFANHSLHVNLRHDRSLYRICENGVAKIFKISDLQYLDFSTEMNIQLTFRKIGYFHFYIPLSFKALQIFICGFRKGSRYLFEELVNVYDSSVWVGLGLTLVCLKITWKLPTRSESFETGTLCLIKVLLEQGNPFPSGAFSISKNRILLGTFLLLGIVISNGYKNENVYNMVLPREPERYQSLDQLIKDQIPLYAPPERYFASRMFIFDYNSTADNGCSDKNQTKLNLAFWPQINRVDILEKGNRFILDTFSYLHTGGTELKMNKLLEKFKENSSVIDTSLYKSEALLYNYSSLIRLENSTILEIFSTLKRKLPEWVFVFTKFNSNYTEFFKEFKRLYNSEMRNLWLEKVEKCNKTAFVIPAGLAKLYADKFYKTGGTLEKKLYFLPGFKFTFQRVIPPELIVRIGDFKQSGILEWWLNILEHVSSIRSNNRNLHSTGEYTTGNKGSDSDLSGPASASMDGNIVVVFTLLICGWLLAIVGFVKELLINM